MEEKLNITLLTHNDLDACGCVIIFKLTYNPAKVEYHTYETIDQAILNHLEKQKGKNLENDRLVIADICPKETTCEKLDEYFKSSGSVALFDHHKTRSWVAKYPWAMYKTDICATLAIFNNYAPFLCNANKRAGFDFSKAVDAWDLWRLDSDYRKRGETLNTLFAFMGTEEFVKIFSKVINADEQMGDLISLLEFKKNRYIKRVIGEQLLKAVPYTDGFGNTFKIIFATDYISEIGNTILNHPDGEDLKYIVIVGSFGDGCSLRSRNNEIDVGNLAKLLKGGGHTNAAGFPLNGREITEKLIAEKLNKLEG